MDVCGIDYASSAGVEPGDAVVGQHAFEDCKGQAAQWSQPADVVQLRATSNVCCN